MSKLATPKYTLVQHSGFGYAHKPGFEHAVEERSFDTTSEADKILKVGGLIFNDYVEAADRAMKENYPDDHEGIYPRAKGSFAKAEIDQLSVYVP